MLIAVAGLDKGRLEVVIGMEGDLVWLRRRRGDEEEDERNKEFIISMADV